MDKAEFSKRLRELADKVDIIGYDENSIILLEQFKKGMDNYESIDKEMVERLNDIFSNDLVKKEKFADIVKAIGEGSTIVYFKSAQLFKVYKKTELESLNEHRNILFKDYDIYQMVDKKSDQKIVIETDLTLLDNVDLFIKYINQFMKTKGFGETNITYSQSESLLFVIDG
jgi:hypothetical protein